MGRVCLCRLAQRLHVPGLGAASLGAALVDEKFVPHCVQYDFLNRLAQLPSRTLLRKKAHDLMTRAANGIRADHF